MKRSRKSKDSPVASAYQPGAHVRQDYTHGSNGGMPQCNVAHSTPTLKRNTTPNFTPALAISPFHHRVLPSIRDEVSSARAESAGGRTRSEGWWDSRGGLRGVIEPDASGVVGAVEGVVGDMGSGEKEVGARGE